MGVFDLLNVGADVDDVEDEEDNDEADEGRDEDDEEDDAGVWRDDASARETGSDECWVEEIKR